MQDFLQFKGDARGGEFPATLTLDFDISHCWQLSVVFNPLTPTVVIWVQL